MTKKVKSTPLYQRHGEGSISSLLHHMKPYTPFYLLLLLPLLQVITFDFLPLYGISIAFKNFKMGRGIAGSDWVGLFHFQKVFTDPDFYRVLFNTLKISITTLITTTPVTIIFALLVNELMGMKFKRVVQTITYLPHFLSWVVVGGFVYQLLSPTNGIVNSFLVSIGAIDAPIYFMVEDQMFVPIYLITTLWKTTGYSIIIYLSSIAGIDTGLYESALIDGANRFQRVIYITLPCIAPTISTLLILNMSSLISVGFDPIFNLYNPSTYGVADVISTYVYRRGLVEARYDSTTAIGLAQNVIALILILLSNFAARKANPDYKII